MVSPSRSRLKPVLALCLLLVLAVVGWQLRSADSARAALPASTGPGPLPSGSGVVSGQDYHHDTSPALRDMPQIPVPSTGRHEAPENPRLPISGRRDVLDTVVQHTLSPLAMPAAVLNFDGIAFPGVSCNCHPPDTNGEVGATQYVQMVNEGYQVFNKSTGASMLGPNSIVSVWSGFGGACQTGGFGDPVVLYDQIAGRWVITQFASATGGTPITDECVAVSTTSDATGSYNRYGFHLGSNFFDYPHLAVWPDAYYMSMNVFDSAGSTFLGPQPFAFNRSAMLAGTSASFVSPVGPLGSTADSFLPADVDGATLPTAGAPESFVAFPGSGVYKTYHFHVDFATPANSTWSTFANPAAAGFTAACTTTRACVPESGGEALDGIGDRLMFRLAYRKFADGHEGVVGNYTVSSGGVTGVRWFELRNVTAGPETVFQESTYQPDSNWRWMGSAAMDGSGDLAVGYSTSSASTHPGIRYAGRLVTDPVNQLSQGESTLITGAGAQTGGGNRWGDYSDMTVDPVDDCTFWYTQEYYTGINGNWHTRIGNFKFPSCGGAPPPTATNTPLPGPTNTPTNTPTRTPTPTNTPIGAPTNTPTNTPTQPAGGGIVNGGFETGSLPPWVVLDTSPAPVVSTAQKHSGSYSALVGAAAAPEPNGNSSLYQQFAVPAGGGTLSYWYWPATTDSITYDWQDAYITDTSGNVLATIMHVCSNAQAWTNVTFNLAPYAGTTVRIKFLAHGDGYGDLTYMYVDDVSLSGAGPTNTPTNTPTKTPTPVVTNTPTPCANVVANPGFESGSLAPWTVLDTSPAPVVSTAQKHSGSFSALVGAAAAPEPNGNSSLYQTVTVPASGGTLSYWYWPATTDSITYDWQDAYVTNTSGNVLATIMHVCSNAQAWTNVTFNMAAYAGTTVRIKFLAHGDGYGDLTYMYVDDVSLTCH